MSQRRKIATSASEDRLEKLIIERLKEDTDNELIDKRIWDLFGETWAIMFTDLSGFSRSVEKFGIIHFLQTIHESERILIPVIEDHDGILLKQEGDSLMVIFRNVTKALRAATAMQHTCSEYNIGRDPEEQILLCVGLGYGKCLKIGDSDIYGPEVNAASKLGEDIAKKDEILVTESVMQDSDDFPDISYEPIDQVPPGANKAYRLIYQ